MSKRSKFLLLIGIAVLLFTQGCKRIPLHDPDGGVFLELNLDLDVKVDLSGKVDLAAHPELKAKALGNIPDLMHVFIYDRKLHTVKYEDYLPLGGGFIDIDPGVYDIIVYGLGTDYTRVIGTESRGTAHAYTDRKQTMVLGARADENPGDDDARIRQYSIITEPDQLYVGRAECVEVPVRPEGDSHIIHLRVDVPPLVQSWTFIAHNITGLERVRELTCYITGQAASRYFWDLHFPTQPVVAIDFPCLVDPETYTVKTVFNTFGKIPEYSSQAILHVTIQDNYGNWYQWQYDVTDQFDNPDNTGHEIIVTDHIDIPDDSDGTGDTGFSSAVKPWDPHFYEIDI